MNKITQEEFSSLSHCIYSRDGVLWVKYDNGLKFTCAPLFSVDAAIENDDGINVCQSDYVDQDFYHVLDDDEKLEIINLLSR